MKSIISINKNYLRFIYYSRQYAEKLAGNENREVVQYRTW